MCSPKTFKKNKVTGSGTLWPVTCGMGVRGTLSEALVACPLKRTLRMVVSLSLSLSNWSDAHPVQRANASSYPTRAKLRKGARWPWPGRRSRRDQASSSG